MSSVEEHEAEQEAWEAANPLRKFTVSLVEKVYYTVEIEAHTEEDAEEGATALWCQSADPTNDYCGAGNGVEAYSIEDSNNS